MVIPTIPLRCADCGKEVTSSTSKSISIANHLRDVKVTDANGSSTSIVEFWWCRDCAQGVCKSCHLMKGHSEHRSNEWRPEEVYRTCVQALEGRCSRRSKQAHEQKLAVKEFIAKVEIILLNELGRTLEAANEPDRRLISRLNRALSGSFDSNDIGVYHVTSPSRPAWKTWNLDQENPLSQFKLVQLYNVLESRPNARLSKFLAVVNSINFIQLSYIFSYYLILERPILVGFAGPSIISIFRSLSPVPSHASAESKPGSVMSSIPAYPCDQSLDSTAVSSRCISDSSTSQAATPTPLTVNGSMIEGEGMSNAKTANQPDEQFHSIGKSFLTRPICVQAFTTKTLPNHLAISDSVYISDVDGKIKEHLLIKNSSASSVTIDERNEVMYISIMQSKGRSVHVFDIANSFRKLEVIVCPKDPKIEMSRTRWLTIGPRGQLFMVSGDNMKSALWCYVRARKAWKTLKESRKTRYQYLSVAEDQAEYKAVVLLTCDAANNRLLLFVVDHTLSLINEYDLSKTYRLYEHISSPASAIVDVHGNLLVLDYSNGKLWILLSGVKGIRRLKEIHLDDRLHSQEALGISTSGA
ncbi:hypothetical protein Angca_001368, partial [Angiostrongylus cantonensis]